VLCLQEVDIRTKRKPVDIVEEIRIKGKFKDCKFVQSMEFQGGSYGNSILSQFPIEDTRTLKFKTFKEEPRTCIAVKVTPSAKIGKCWIITTHLSFHIDVLKLQWQELINFCIALGKEDEIIPIFVGGDFNLPRSEESVKWLQSTVPWEEIQFTISSLNMNIAISSTGNITLHIKHKLITGFPADFLQRKKCVLS
jgi:endonuclease/exonuclease/phosphatase family metal-dependent hydrolase